MLVSSSSEPGLLRPSRPFRPSSPQRKQEAADLKTRMEVARQAAAHPYGAPQPVRPEESLWGYQEQAANEEGEEGGGEAGQGGEKKAGGGKSAYELAMERAGKGASGASSGARGASSSAGNAGGDEDDMKPKSIWQVKKAMPTGPRGVVMGKFGAVPAAFTGPEEEWKGEDLTGEGVQFKKATKPKSFRKKE
eukprot:tig00000057_g139.t1